MELTLTEGIKNLNAEFAGMQTKLYSAQMEITRLQREVETYERRLATVSGQGVSSLRKKVAYYCHPDRGGDSFVMSKINSLFDSLESI